MSAAWDLVYGSTLWFAFGGCEEGMKAGRSDPSMSFSCSQVGGSLRMGQHEWEGQKAVSGF